MQSRHDYTWSPADGEWTSATVAEKVEAVKGANYARTSKHQRVESLLESLSPVAKEVDPAMLSWFIAC